MTAEELARDIAIALIAKSGVREYESPEVRAAIAAAAVEIANAIYYVEEPMALPDVFRLQTGTRKTLKSSAGDAAITLASLANSSSESTGARQAAKLDLGASRAEVYAVRASFEIAATPTAGAVIELWWSPSSSGTAGTDNPGGASGTDAAYTGYSNNITASLKHCQLIGLFICTAQATATIQVGIVGRFSPMERYGSLIVWNKSGAAIHTSDSNCKIELIPDEPTIEDS